MSICIRPFDGKFGAEVIGFDFEINGDEETFTLMRDAWVEHAVICIRHQQIEPEYFLKLANIFGEPMPQLINHKNFALPSQGGSTGFTNQALAYENLSFGMKNKIDGLKAKHVYQSKYSARKMPTRSKEDEALSPTSLHPIARTHPVTGRKAIYLNPVRTESIEGMNETDAQALLNELLEHSTQDKFRYSHDWKSDDVLLWDNRQTMHMAANDSHLYDRERRMHRVMIKGDTPF